MALCPLNLKHTQPIFYLKLYFLGFAGVRTRQLNEFRQWRRLFRASAVAEGEIVVFDILCGNLGFDNMSTGAYIYILLDLSLSVCKYILI